MPPFLKEQIEALCHLIFGGVEEEGKEGASETFPEQCIALVLLALVLTLFYTAGEYLPFEKESAC